MSVSYRVAKRQDIAPGEVHRVEAGGSAVAVCNVDGAFHAIDDTCSHEEASLSDGWLDGTELSCPLHGATFDVTTGAVLTLPATRGVRSYPVRLEGDDIYIEV